MLIFNNADDVINLNLDNLSEIRRNIYCEDNKTVQYEIKAYMTDGSEKYLGTFYRPEDAHNFLADLVEKLNAEKK